MPAVVVGFFRLERVGLGLGCGGGPGEGERGDGGSVAMPGLGKG